MCLLRQSTFYVMSFVYFRDVRYLITPIELVRHHQLGFLISALKCTNYHKHFKHLYLASAACITNYL